MDYKAHQDPLSMGFPREEYQSGLPLPSPRDLPDPGIKTTSPALQADSLLLSHMYNNIKFHKRYSEQKKWDTKDYIHYEYIHV